MKVAFIVVLYKTPKKEVDRLKKEIAGLKFENIRTYFIDNSKNNLGYAAGVNIGIRRALNDKCDYFIICNPDISLKGIVSNKMLEGLKYFDVLGFTMKQNSKTYYGGEIDEWRMSGGLLARRPKKRFFKSDFITGSLMIIKRNVIEKVGLFDEGYGMYYEDVDYCVRASKAGFRVGVDGDVVYKHFELSAMNEGKSRQLFKSRLRFFLKYSNFNQKIRELVRLPKTVFEESKFIFNFISLNISSIIIKLLNFLLFLALARTLTLKDYGVYTLVWAHIGLLSPLADLGTTTFGIVNIKDKKDKQLSNLFSIRIFLSIIVLILTLILSFVFRYSPLVVLLIAISSPVIFSNMSSGMLLIILSIKEKLYKASVISIIFNLFLILALILTSYRYRNLVYIFAIIGVFYGLYFLFNFFLVKKEGKNLRIIFESTVWKKIVQGSFVFVIISFFAGLYFKLDIFLLNFLKGQREVGIYSAGYKFLEASMFIAASYNITSIPIMAKIAKNKEALIKKVKRDSSLLLFLGLVVSLLGFFLASRALPIILTKEYFMAIDVFKIVIFALPLLLVTSVFLNALYVLKKAYLVIFLFFGQVLLNLVLNLIFIPKYSYFASSYITILSEFINLFASFVLLKISLRND